MNEIFASPYFGVALSVIAFGLGVKLNQKFRTPFCNPLIIAIVLVSAVLLIFRIPYESYNKEERSSICFWRRRQPVWR